LVFVRWLGKPGVIRQIPPMIAPNHGTCVKRLARSPAKIVWPVESFVNSTKGGPRECWPRSPEPGRSRTWWKFSREARNGPQAEAVNGSLLFVEKTRPSELDSLGNHVGMVVILMIIRRSHTRRIIAIGLRPGAAGNAKQEGQGE